jgi:hypothetical protein
MQPLMQRSLVKECIRGRFKIRFRSGLEWVGHLNLLRVAVR